MQQNFGQDLDSTTLRRVWYAEAPIQPEEQILANGTKRPQGPALWNIIAYAKAKAPAGSYSGATFEVRASVGDGQQVRTYTLGALARRWRGRATSIEVWAAATVADETLIFSGGATWLVCQPDGFGGSPVLGTHLVGTKTLSYTQANSDSAIAAVASLGVSQEEARRFSITSGPLTGGSAMVPVTVIIYGRRFIGSEWVPLDSMVVTSGVGGGNALTIEVVPGQYDEIGYQVTGFAAAAVGVTGSATMHVWEELDSEGC